MLMDADNCVLLVVDVQERLLPHIEGWQRVLESAVWLVGVAGRVGVPVAATEQYPKGIGPTHADIKALLPTGAIGEKMDFSCVSAGCLPPLPGADRRQWVVCGIESHVCVLQTVLQLRQEGKEVFVVEDAVGSRRASDKALALERMRRHGIDVVSREMVAFEWLKRAGSDLFRGVSRDFLR